MNAKLNWTETRSDAAKEFDDVRSRALVVPSHNFVLAALPRNDLNTIVSSSKAVHFKAGEVVYEIDGDIDYIYFPINSIFSAVAILEDGSTVEISMTGREGLLGIAAMIGGGRSIHWTRTLVAGEVLRVPTPVLQDLFKTHHDASEAILEAYQRIYTQICQRSVCNVRHTLLQRRSTWLLMVADRIESEQLPFTQEQIASHISVRRAGVSVAASHLQGVNAISYHRGLIVIRDRPAIEDMACECYDVLSREFRGGRDLNAAGQNLMSQRLRHHQRD